MQCPGSSVAWPTELRYRGRVLARCVLRGCLTACALVACGRVGFDPSADSGSDSSQAIASIQVLPPRFETTSTEFVDVSGGTLVVPPSPGQRWLFLLSARLASSSGTYNAPEGRYVVDGIERGIGGTEAIVTSPGPWQHFYMFDGADTPTTISLQARDTLAATTSLDHVRMVVVPLPASADPLYASSDDAIPVASLTAQTIASLALAPATAGEYLVLLVVNASEAPDTSDIFVQWLDPGGQAWTEENQVSRGAWQSVLHVRRAVLSGPTTVALQGRSGATATARYARAAAVRIDAFENLFAEALTTTDISTTSAVPTVAQELRPALGSASSYLVLASSSVDDNCGNATLAARGTHFTVDSFVQATTHVTDNCAYEATYGYVGIHDVPPTVVSSAVSSGNGQSVTLSESSLVVLGIP